MKIIKEGNLLKTKKRFTCGACGCEFIADGLEYKLILSGYIAKCPCCSQFVEKEKGQEDD